MQTVAASLYDEGAVTVIYAILVNCRFMLERSSNNYGKLIIILVIMGHIYGLDYCIKYIIAETFPSLHLQCIACQINKLML